MDLFKSKFLLGFLILILSGCSLFKDKDPKIENLATAEELYNQAFVAFDKNNHEKAIAKFEDIERTYPYSKWATKAQLMSAYVSYSARDYDSAVISAERFVKLHPGRDEVDYAYYLKALSYYEQIVDIQRDQGNSVKAKDALKEVVAKFPNSKYAKDAQLKIDLVTNNLAGKEVDVGRYYLKKGNINGAINRFKYVIDNYQTTSHIQEALHRLVEAYLSLGVISEAKKYGAVLGHNYPNSKWYKQSYKLLKEHQG